MEFKFGKWLAGGLGFALGGPIGGLMGFILGSLYDKAEDTLLIGGEAPTDTQRLQGDFYVSLLVLAASVMKADGKTIKSELEYIKGFLRTNFGVERTKEYLQVLKALLEKEFSTRQVCIQIRENTNHATRLQLMHFLFGIAAADGKVDTDEENLLRLIAEYMYINHQDYESLKAMFVKSADWAYKVLETEEHANDEELKKAYRKMAAKYHPDKVSSLGDDAINAANDKFQQLNAAYDHIKKQRGIK